MTEQTQEQAPNLTLNDIATAVRVIDLSSERGALRGDELAVVGMLRERLVAFLKAASPAEEVSEEVSEEVPAEE